MVYEWYDSTRTLKTAVILYGVTLLIFITAFFTPYWLQSHADENLPNPKFTNLGLWEVCLNGFHDMRHQYEFLFYGCRHILLEEYDIIRDEIQPPFFIATQFFYTLSFIALLLSMILIVMYLLCVDEYYRVSVLKWTGIGLIFSGILGTIALIIFGANGDGRDFMPDWEHNNFSWFWFGLHRSIVLLHRRNPLFIVEGRIMRRREKSQEKEYHMNPMEKMERRV